MKLQLKSLSEESQLTVNSCRWRILCILAFVHGLAGADNELGSHGVEISLPYFNVKTTNSVFLVPSVHFALRDSTSNLLTANFYLPKNTKVFFEYYQNQFSEGTHPFEKPRYVATLSVRKTLREKLGKTFEALTQRSGRAAAPLDTLADLHPFFLLSAVEGGCAYLDASQKMPLDILFRLRAREQNATFESLETLDDAFISVATLPIDVWIDSINYVGNLVLAGKCQELSKRYFEEMNVAIATGDTQYALKATEQYHESVYGTTELLRRYISKKRNTRMSEKIIEVMQTVSSADTSIILVGAAHFAGDNGLLKILCRAGAEVNAKNGALPIDPCGKSH